MIFEDSSKESNRANTEKLLRKCAFPIALSLTWRIVHFTFYFLGGLLFFIGSIMYYPEVNKLTWGGWLFTIGGFALTVADGMDWWTNNRVGCLMYKDYEADYEVKLGYLFEPASTTAGRIQRAYVGFNFFWSFVGSFLYFVGSIFLIPSLKAFLIGDFIYVVASLIIMLAQWAKLIRAGYDYSTKYSYSLGFRFENWLRDFAAVAADFCEGGGALGYLVGTLLFLPQTDINSSITTASATWFVAGGAFYLAAALFLGYRYFFTLTFFVAEQQEELFNCSIFYRPSELSRPSILFA